MKKFFLTAMIIVLLSFNVLPASAAEIVAVPMNSEEIVTPASEETVWYNRIYNGMLQRRLWSITYGEWLTEWEDVAPIV